MSGKAAKRARAEQHAERSSKTFKENSGEEVPTEYLNDTFCAKVAPHAAQGDASSSVEALARNYGRIRSGPMSGKYISTSVWATGAPHIWRQGNTGQSITVAVLDTGIDDTHPDLAGKVALRRDYVRDGKRPSEFEAHGTHCAGIIAANGILLGVAPDATLLDYRVLGPRGGSWADIADAVRHAADRADIISMSLGGGAAPSFVHEAIKYAVNTKNVLVVVAAGNDGTEADHGIGRVAYPSFYPEVISVGAVEVANNGDVTHAYFSNANHEVDLCCDGYHVLSTVPNKSYQYMNGTSMACPVAAGVAALLLAKARSSVGLGRNVGDKEVFPMLKASTIDLPDPTGRGREGHLGVDWLFGAGFLTFYPTLPKAVDKEWILPNMDEGAPDPSA